MDGIENQAWTKADRFFLADALARGMSTAEVAAFLGRTEDEVRGQCEALRLLSAVSAHWTDWVD